MKQLDLNIDTTGITFGDGTDPVDAAVSFIDQAIASSFAHSSPKGITDNQQREIHDLVKTLERHQHGIVQLRDPQWAALIGWWRTRNMPPLVGANRRLCMAIDRILQPDEWCAKEEPVP